MGSAVDADYPYWEADLSGPLALVVGSEGSGLGRLVRESVRHLVNIPMAAGRNPVAQCLGRRLAGAVRSVSSAPRTRLDSRRAGVGGGGGIRTLERLRQPQPA